jgi:hypothetical protein
MIAKRAVIPDLGWSREVVDEGTRRLPKRAMLVRD